VHTQTSTARRKPRGEGATRREEILAAAKRLFLTEGYEHATIRKIAASVGVTSGTLYLYFPDKDAILRAIAEATFGALLARLQEVWSADAEPLDRLRAGMHAYIQFGLAHPDEYRLTFLSKMMAEAVPGRTSACPPDIEAADRSFEVLLNEAAGLIRAGIFRDMDPVAAAEALWACMHGATALLLDHADHLDTSQANLAATVVDMAVRGLCRS
jgi:AcrR family transcriptional regulator